MTERCKGNYCFTRVIERAIVMADQRIDKQVKAWAKESVLKKLERDYPNYKWKALYSRVEHFDFLGNQVKLKYRCIGMRRASNDK